jgi:hypothetical protein
MIGIVKSASPKRADSIGYQFPKSRTSAKHTQLAVTPNALIQHNLRAPKAIPQYKSPETRQGPSIPALRPDQNSRTLLGL